jgi:hypothetical protein
MFIAKYNYKNIEINLHTGILLLKVWLYGVHIVQSVHCVCVYKREVGRGVDPLFGVMLEVVVYI